MIQITDNTYTNHSGGAIGSDSYWSYIGDMYGVKSNLIGTELEHLMVITKYQKMILKRVVNTC